MASHHTQATMATRSTKPAPFPSTRLPLHYPGQAYSIAAAARPLAAPMCFPPPDVQKRNVKGRIGAPRPAPHTLGIEPCVGCIKKPRRGIAVPTKKADARVRVADDARSVVTGGVEEPHARDMEEWAKARRLQLSEKKQEEKNKRDKRKQRQMKKKAYILRELAQKRKSMNPLEAAQQHELDKQRAQELKSDGQAEAAERAAVRHEKTVRRWERADALFRRASRRSRGWARVVVKASPQWDTDSDSAAEGSKWDMGEKQERMTRCSLARRYTLLTQPAAADEESDADVPAKSVVKSFGREKGSPPTPRR